MSRYATVGARAPYPEAQRLLQVQAEFLRTKQPGDSFAVAGGTLQSHSGLPAMTPTNPQLLTSRRPGVGSVAPGSPPTPTPSLTPERRYGYVRWDSPPGVPL